MSKATRRLEAVNDRCDGGTTGEAFEEEVANSYPRRINSGEGPDSPMGGSHTDDVVLGSWEIDLQHSVCGGRGERHMWTRRSVCDLKMGKSKNSLLNL